MKSIKNKELNKLSAEELQSKLSEVRVELMKANAQVAMKTTPQNPGMIKTNKKMVARIHTLLTQKSGKKEE
ncbi:MAG: 50S ribosomal protein L29 [Candidatus Woesearchaeota archaeon]